MTVSGNSRPYQQVPEGTVRYDVPTQSVVVFMGGRWCAMDDVATEPAVLPPDLPTLRGGDGSDDDADA
jgi:hypothetical protein